jgi:hypothetical protein
VLGTRTGLDIKNSSFVYIFSQVDTSQVKNFNNQLSKADIGERKFVEL